MLSLVWLLLFAGGAVFLAYQRVSLRTATIAAAAALAAYSLFGYGSLAWMVVLWAALALLVALNIEPLRKRWAVLGFDARTLVHAKDNDVLEAVSTGPTLLTRLDGEWW